MDTLQESLSQLSSQFMERMNSFEGELRKGTSSTPTITTLAEDFTAFKSFVVNALRGLQNQFCILASTADQLEMRSRRKILLFHGVPEENQEDTLSLVAKIIVNKLKQGGFQASDVKRCYRMGKSPISSTKPRPILVKFGDTAVRNQVWYSKKNLKASGITLSEFLTKIRHDLFMKARKHFGVTKCWTRDGSVYLSSGGTKYRIDNVQDFDSVIRDTDLEGSNVPLISTKQLTITVPKTRRQAKK